VASPGLDSLTLRGLVEPAWTLQGHLMLQDNYGLKEHMCSTWTAWTYAYLCNPRQCTYAPMADLNTFFLSRLDYCMIELFQIDVYIQ
jgi:hypothetical protein